ncbi:MAG: hypothetical protein A2Y82_01050 [Candidatus Buchananbacteria bacterium RBG_13_36_9]|uniref:Uncharacterized protein n=1 Tax=Candidatus Buchananbacteria bacterium RBG_13_36_9 TaxID=1797530 RepID=A0A1G1XNH4_9BACT|nr:MAG: hypothetical protein A2Y82_01050 [Candidatus Buchananbacteria bacterium RBG_13_36_9]
MGGTDFQVIVRHQRYYKILLAMQKKALTKHCPFCDGQLALSHSIWTQCKKCKATIDLATVITKNGQNKKYC